MQRIGIIAGAGSLPLEVARSVTGRGGFVHVVMVDGAADPALTSFPHTLVNWAQPGRAMAAFRQANIKDAVLLGGYGRPSFATARPDLTFLRLVPAVVRLLKAGGDDAVLRGVLAQFEALGLHILSVGDVAPELLVAEGVPTRAAPSAANDADIALGFDLVAALGQFDIGQAVVVSGGKIEAIEGAEGTDRMLQRVAAERAARGHGEQGGVLVKRPKPGQDMRVDLPTIGPNSVARAREAGLAGIAVMAGHVLAVDRPEIIARADAEGLFVVGIKDERPSPPPARAASSDIAWLGSVRGDHAGERDVLRAAGILQALSAFNTGTAVVIDQGRVLAVGASESPLQVTERTGPLRGPKPKRRGIAVLAPGQAQSRPLLDATAAADLCGIAATGKTATVPPAVIAAANELSIFAALLPFSPDVNDKIPSMPTEIATKPLKIFLVAGEHSGDALGSKLMRGLRQRYQGPMEFAGVGGEDMAHEGFASIFPLEDVAVMGPLSILPKLPRIIRRVHQTVDAALAFKPDIVVIIDSPEFTHPIAKRIRKRAPEIPIVDYVSPSVWAWRPGRARKMRPYVDHILALLPFEPAAHDRLGGPKCTYVGHPLIEKLDEIQNADSASLAAKLKLDPARPVLLVLPGSRTSEVERLIDVFGDAVALVAEKAGPIEVVIPAVRHLRERIAAKTAEWKIRPHIVDSEEKYAAMRLARAALAASGTVTLELALAQTPAVVAYKVDAIMANLRFLLKVPSIVLANLVIGRNVYPEFLQEACTPEILASALLPLIGDTPERSAQLEGLKLAPHNMQLEAANPSEAAAAVVLSVLKV
jgi:lipid-A-disaccharide synthase